MIGGLPSNSYGPLQPERPAQRAPAEVTRPESGTRAETDRQQINDDNGRTRQLSTDPQLLERRVQAREAAKDGQFERFRADEVPLANARALDVFTGIASQREEGDVELAGVDIRV
jgi:hypothetical protein